VDGIEAARHRALDMLHRGNARGYHLEGGVERVQIKIDLAPRDTAREPQLQRMIGGAHLQWSHADMVMAVDETRQHDVVRIDPEFRVGRLLLHRIERASGDDNAVAGEHGALLDHHRRMPVLNACDDPPGLEDKFVHDCFLSTRSAPGHFSEHGQPSLHP
jgi:hypothetical protein